MAPGPESVLVGKIKKAVAERWPESFVTKMHGSAYSTAGMPDLLVVIDGYAICLEVKAPRANESAASLMSRVTPIQFEMLHKIQKAGGIAEVCWDVAQALDIIQSQLPSKDRAETSKDIRLNALAASENAMRKSIEHMEAELQAARVEIETLKKKVPSA